MAQPVEITVKTQLSKIIKELDGIQKNFDSAERGMKKTVNEVDDGITSTMRNTQSKVEQAGSTMRRVFIGLKDDIKALTSVGALAGGLKLANTMRGTVTEAIDLNDTVRKLSGVLNIAESDGASFVGKLTKGLGQIGLGADSAVRSLEGLAQTQVRGQENLEEYSRMAGMLAGAGNQRGQEGAISKGLAGVVQAQGKNVNDIQAARTIAEQVNRTYEATGTSPTEVMDQMRELLKGMNSDFKKTMTPKAMSSLIAAGSERVGGGTGAMDFFKRYLGETSLQRQRTDALMGVSGKNLFNDKTGINKAVLQDIISNAKGIGGGNIETGLGIEGFSPEEAKGLILLAQNIDVAQSAAEKASTSTKKLAKSFDDAKTMGEAFKGNLNRVKSTFSELFAGISGGITDTLKTTQKSDTGAAAVVVGSTLAAAILTKIGLGGVGSAFGIKNMQEKALEAQGENVQKVHVTNFNEAPGGLGGLGGAAGGAAAEVAGVSTAIIGSAAAVGVATILAGIFNEKQQRDKIMEPLKTEQNKDQEVLNRMAGYLQGIHIETIRNRKKNPMGKASFPSIREANVGPSSNGN